MHSTALRYLPSYHEFVGHCPPGYPRYEVVETARRCGSSRRVAHHEREWDSSTSQVQGILVLVRGVAERVVPRRSLRPDDRYGIEREGIGSTAAAIDTSAGNHANQGTAYP